MNSINYSKLSNQISYITGEQAKKIDDELMGKDINYSIYQLMEIAGLSVAMSIHDAITNNADLKSVKKILNISGPGSKL